MRLSLNIALQADSTGRRELAFMRDPEWAKRAADIFRATSSARSQTQEVFLQEQQIRKDHLEKLWTRLVVAFNEKHMALNQELGRVEVLTIVRNPDTKNFTIRRNQPSVRRICVSLEETTYSILLQEQDNDFYKLRYAVQVDRQNGLGYLADISNKGEEIQPEMIAELAIEHLLASP